MPPELIGPECPELHRALWDDFLEFQRGRGDGGFWTEFEAWARLTARRLSPQDVALIVDLERLAFEVRAKGKK